jgi:hypothetical protein
MDVRILRPPHMCRQESPVRGWLLAAILFGSVVAFGTATAKQVSPEVELQKEAVAEFDIPAAGQYISIRKVEDGEEALHLSARLSENSVDVISNVSWKISQSKGGPLFDATTAILEKTLPPGDYTVEASYGLAKIREEIALPKSSALNISFVMNAGALRVLPALKDIPRNDIQSTSKIYALDGQFRGQLVATADIGGEVMVMTAGKYRVETAYKPGNVSAVTDVAVKPGVMSAANISHLAGIITFVAENDEQWSVQAPDGNTIAEINGRSVPFVLKPGLYTATKKSAVFNRTLNFEVKAGQQSELTLND